MLLYCNTGQSMYHMHTQGNKKLWKSYTIMLNFRYFCNTDLYTYLERSDISNVLHDILPLCMTYVTLENTSLRWSLIFQIYFENFLMHIFMIYIRIFSFSFLWVYPNFGVKLIPLETYVFCCKEKTSRTIIHFHWIRYLELSIPE